MKTTESIPAHLRRYIATQDVENYTPVDHAVWRFALRQLRSYLAKHAHEAYLTGLEETGIEIERIPRIEDISGKISKFGWRALPVSGFIPPAAFMELQALSILPIACDVRTLDHLLYTPAPDIVHEAAGHAPMLAHQEFADYLREYAQIARKAIISQEDMDLYKAIRVLSDVKENPQSTPEDIADAERQLETVSRASSHVSEATWLSRMNWWTAEYGLIGSLSSPRIFGAGLLSSVGESRWCLSSRVKKIPLTIDCIETGYDITEPQPQLFVAEDFKALSKVLSELADRMAFRVGGAEGVRRIIAARTVNTVELNSGVQISGKCIELLTDAEGAPAYLRFEGPCQLAIQDRQLSGHGKDHHAQGFGTPVGFLKPHPSRCPSEFTDAEWENLGARDGEKMTLEYTSGARVSGIFVSRTKAQGKTIVLTLKEAKAEMGGRTLFQPEWGVFDIAIGSTIPSVYGGPADRASFGETDDFVAAKVPLPKRSESDRRRHENYQKVRDLREGDVEGTALTEVLGQIFDRHSAEFPDDWLLILEMFEIALNRGAEEGLLVLLRSRLEHLMKTNPEKADIIRDGLALATDL